MFRHHLLAAAACLMLLARPAAATPLILAAESVYGQVAAVIAGPQARVVSVLSQPGQDPHEFEASASTAREAAVADIVIVNGAGYDAWMDSLLGASPVPGREVISAARLMQAGQGANPHLWYDPETMPRVARALAAALSRRDPASAALFQQRLSGELAALEELRSRVAALRVQCAGVPVTATEPVFGYMAAALGLDMRNERFQLAVMNGTEPRSSDVAAMENDLREHRVRVLIYNAQVTDPATERLKTIARDAGIPLVAVTETLPARTTYTAWMLDQLNGLARALAPHT